MRNFRAAVAPSPAARGSRRLAAPKPPPVARARPGTPRRARRGTGSAPRRRVDAHDGRDSVRLDHERRRPRPADEGVRPEIVAQVEDQLQGPGREESARDVAGRGSPDAARATPPGPTAARKGHMCADHRTSERGTSSRSPPGLPAHRRPGASPARRPGAAHRGSAPPAAWTAIPCPTVARKLARGRRGHRPTAARSPTARPNRSRTPWPRRPRDAELSSRRMGSAVSLHERSRCRSPGSRADGGWVGQVVGHPAQEMLGDGPRRRLADRLGIEPAAPPRYRSRALRNNCSLLPKRNRGSGD